MLESLVSLIKDTSMTKFHEHPISFSRDMSHIVENDVPRNVEESLKIP